MSEQDVEVETQESEDVTVEATETEAPEVESEEVETQEPELTAEERLAQIETDNKGKQEKINRQTKAYNALQQTYQKQQAELQKLMEMQQANAPKQEPSIDDFETHDEYVNAMVDFKTEQAVSERQEQMLKAQQQQQQQALMQERTNIKAQQEAEYIVENPMYKASAQEVATFVQQNNAPEPVANAVLDVLYTGNVPKVIDYFGANNGERLGELQSIMQMPPHMAAIEVYKIQQGLGAPQKKEVKKPPSPLKKPKAKSSSAKPLSKKDSSSVLEWVNS